MLQRNYPWIICILFIINGWRVLGNDIGYQIQTSHGFLVTPYDRVKHLSTYTYGYDVDIQTKAKGDKLWHHTFNNPYMGLKINYINYKIKDVLGASFGLLAYLDIPIIENKYLTFSLQNGWGLGYFNEIFHPVTNYRNKAIGSNINIGATLQSRLTFNITQNWKLGTSLGFTHYSCGALFLPNNGLNTVHANFMIGYQPNRIKKIDLNEELPKTKDAYKRKSIDIFLGYGNKAEGKFGEKRINTLWLNGLYNFNSFSNVVSQFSIGTDIFYDAGIQYETFYPFPKEKGLKNQIQVGTKASYTVWMDKLGFCVDAGAYVYHPHLERTGRWYQNFGFKYQFTNRLALQWLTKTHFGNADFMSLGLKLGL
jgi:hypothetical protein